MGRPAVPLTIPLLVPELVNAPIYRPFVRTPLATQAELAREPAAFPVTSIAEPLETPYADWRRRLVRNLSRRSDGRWDPLTYVHGEPL